MAGEKTKCWRHYAMGERQQFLSSCWSSVQRVEDIAYRRGWVVEHANSNKNGGISSRNVILSRDYATREKSIKGIVSA